MQNIRSQTIISLNHLPLTGHGGEALLQPDGEALLQPDGEALLQPDGEALLQPGGEAPLRHDGEALLRHDGEALLRVVAALIQVSNPTGQAPPAIGPVCRSLEEHGSCGRERTELA